MQVNNLTENISFLQECADTAADFRAEQCAAYNGVPFMGHTYTWVPFQKGIIYGNTINVRCKYDSYLILEQSSFRRRFMLRNVDKNMKA